MPTAKAKPKARPIGRPRMEEGKAKGIITPVRLSPEVRAQVDRAAAKAELSVSEWIRRTLTHALR